MVATRFVVIRSLLANLALALLACGSAWGAAPSIAFVAPHGGEVYAVGQAQQVRLDPKTRAKAVKIELSRDGGATFELLGSIDNTAKDVNLRNLLSFTVTGPASSNCVLRASGTIGKATVAGTSCAFSIGSAGAPPPESITSASLAPASVGTDALADGAVTTPKLADKAAVAVKIGSEEASSGMILQADGTGGATWGSLPPSTGSFTGVLAGDVTGTQAATVVSKVAGVTAANVASGANLANAATEQNKPSTIVKRDANGNFSAGTITAALAGNAATATALRTARAINGTSFDGSADVTVPMNVVDDNTTDGWMYLMWADGAGNTQARISTTQAAINPRQSALTVANLYGDVQGSLIFSDGSLNLSATSPDATADAQGGKPVYIYGASAVDGTQNHLSATGGPINLVAGLGANGGPRGALNVTASSMSVNASATFTGAVTLGGDPTSNLHAATKQYVDAGDAAATQYADNAAGAKVSKSGDTMTGLLILSGDPTSALHPATKQYVDAAASAKVRKSGDTMTGLLTLSGDPTTSLQAATKGYVDQVASSVVPTGFSILGNTPTPPAGFTFTGNTVQNLNVWATKASLPTARDEVGGASVGNTIYVIGGLHSGVGYATVEAYDVSGNIWTTKTPMPTARYCSAVVAVGSVIYVIGGDNGVILCSTNEAYDTTHDSWTTLAPMPTARWAAYAAAVNGIIYVIGGDAGNGSEVKTVEAYDLSLNTWTTKAPKPTAERGAGIVAVNGLIYAFGGSANNAATMYPINEVYNPTANTWTSKSPMLVKRDGAAVASIGNTIYVFGGASVGGGPQDTTFTNQIYDTVSDSWTAGVSLPTPRGGMAAAALNSNIYVIGSSANEVYDTAKAVYYVHEKN